jgi:dihydroorotate dehydrogenase (NAD+) catalytic subunit
MVDTTVKFCELEFKNPVVAVSGPFGNYQECLPYFDPGLLGAITTKAITVEPRYGNKTPRIAETPAGMLNAIGLQNTGIDAFICDDLPFLQQFRKRGTHLIANISGSAVEEYANLAQRLAQAGGIDIIEVNVSCPNVDHGGAQFGIDPILVEEIARRVKGVARDIPVIMKLTPNVTDIKLIAEVAVRGGADGISAINTFIATAVDPETRKLVLANKTGGLSGPAIKPLALERVRQIATKLPSTPILGMGGVMSGTDVVEFLAVGATLVGVGTAFLNRPTAPTSLVYELVDYCKTHSDVERVANMIGDALKEDECSA